MQLKYGCNPHQDIASVFPVSQGKLPFTVLNGIPGYINLLDAINAWQLVKETNKVLCKPAAASFKHVSPAGSAVGNTVTQAYKKARSTDPTSSFGDFIAISQEVDLECAEYIKTVVSDGIIAPNFTTDALNILQEKKKGNFIILQIDPSYEPPLQETRDIFGIRFTQTRNNILLTKEKLLHNIVTENKDVTDQVIEDLILASITIKYTQSNSVGYAQDGMMLGVGAGQQSRVDCTRLAGKKTWYNRTLLSDLSLSSDAFFPFRDNIDIAASYGVKYIVQTGGSIRDSEVIDAANSYNMVMFFSNIRLFHH